MERITRLQEEPVKTQEHFTTNGIKRTPSRYSSSSALRMEMVESERVVTFSEPGGSSGMPSSPLRVWRPEQRHSHTHN